MDSSKASQSPRDTRRAPRLAFLDTPWVFALLRGPEGEIESLRTEAKNISRTGVKFLSNTRFALFSPMHMRIYVRNGKGDSFDLDGKIVRLEETDTGHGEKVFGIAVEFQSVDSNSAKRLADVLPSDPKTAASAENILTKK